MSERTEAPTPKRLTELRGKGQVARSQELVSAAGLLAAFWMLQAYGSSVGLRLQEMLVGTYVDLGAAATTLRTGDIDLLWAEQALGRAMQAWLWSILPLGLVLLAIDVVGNYAQGPVFTLKPLTRGFSALNPLTGLQRMFSFQQAGTNLLRSLGKIAIVGVVSMRALQGTVERLPEIDGSTDPASMAAFIGQAVLGIGLSGAQALLVLALLDLGYQRWSFSRSAKMTREEVKEEYKQQEGDPQLKAQIRGRQRKIAQMRRQLQDVPNAAVVVTNPTHFAVALQYNAAMASPRVVAKGADLIAQKIKDVARQAGVPIVENKPLARGLYQSAEVGDDIPLELYQAVAEVLAYVFSLRRRRAR